MGEWLWWTSGALCGALAVAKALVTAWCVVELRRHWRAAPGLWVVDWLDVVWRLHRELGVRLTGADSQRLSGDERAALTAGQLRGGGAGRRSGAGGGGPAGGWEGVG